MQAAMHTDSVCSILALLCTKGLSQKTLYITGNYAGFTYVLLSKACKKT